MSDPYKIGYVGLGNIGVQVCNNLGRYASSNNLPPLSIWNRSPEKYTQVAEDCKGAHLAKEVEEVVERSNVIFTCLLDDTAAENVYGKMFEAVKGKGEEGLVFADQSTLNPKTARKLQANAQQVGVTYLSCPVFGQVAAAKAAQIVLVISGAEAGRERIKPMLVPAIGRATIDVGEDVGKGSSLKLLGNTCILGTVELLAETYALADSIDFDPSVLYTLIQQVFPSPIWLNYGNRISKGDFDASSGFRIDGGLKGMMEHFAVRFYLAHGKRSHVDAKHILSLGEDMGHPCPVPTIERAVQNLNRAKEIGGPGLDWSSLAIATREQAGLEPFRAESKQGKSK